MKLTNYDEIDITTLTIDEAQEYVVWLMLELDRSMDEVQKLSRIASSRDETVFMNEFARSLVRKTWRKIKKIQSEIDYLHETFGV